MLTGLMLTLQACDLGVVGACPEFPDSRAIMIGMLRCPQCSKVMQVPDDYAPRPFCSTRCKLADLHNWFSEVYRIPGEPLNEELSDEPPED